MQNLLHNNLYRSHLSCQLLQPHVIHSNTVFACGDFDLPNVTVKVVRVRMEEGHELVQIVRSDRDSVCQAGGTNAPHGFRQHRARTQQHMSGTHREH